MQTVKEKSLPQRYEAVAAALREGKANSVTSAHISTLTGVSQRDVMLIIEQLIKKHGYCIGGLRSGNNKGYFIITSDDELKEVLKPYEAELQSMLDRVRSLNKNWIEKQEV